MSSPISSLKKSKKTALPGNNQPGQRPVPFRFPQYSDDEDRLLSEITTPGSTSSRQSNYSYFGDSTSRKRDTGMLPGLQLPKLTSPSAMSATPPNDYELMTSMMNKIALLEKRVTFYSKEIIEKDKKIKILEEKCLLLSRYKGEQRDESSRVRELEHKCLSLQHQVQDMEEFLSDYGMMWVGDDKKTDNESQYDILSDREDGDDDDNDEENVWRPATSVPPPAFQVDFNKVIENIKELNVLAGEGVHRIQRTIGGARLRPPDPIPLTLYANGIVMFSGPFRSYDEPETQLCMKDLTDGYFPFELQPRYPEGIPFLVTDKREVYFEDTRHQEHFPGMGQVLGGDHKPSVLLPSNLDKTSSTWSRKSEKPKYVTSELPGPKLTVEQFLNKLPQSVIKEGKVIDVRSSIGDTIKPDPGKPGVKIIETPALKELKERAEKPQAERPKSARDVTTLRIKSEAGDKTFILKMRFHDTIGDLRQYLNAQRPPGASGYDILTTFPNKMYTDDNATLAECELIPNATLLLKSKK
ncbi:UBX domain-containing protein 11-like [Glandiceps talaboti]